MSSWRDPVVESVSFIILLYNYVFYIIFDLRKIWSYPFYQSEITLL